MLVVGNAAYKINLETDSIHCIRLDFVLVLFAPCVIYSIMQIDADDVPRSRTLPWKSVRRELPPLRPNRWISDIRFIFVVPINNSEPGGLYGSYFLFTVYFCLWEKLLGAASGFLDCPKWYGDLLGVGADTQPDNDGDQPGRRHQ
jgi:hypothetical protein